MDVYRKIDARVKTSLIRQGKHSAARRWHGGGYAQSTVIGNYNVEYERDDDSGGERLLFWSSENIPCIAIDIDPEYQSSLNMLRYDQKCAADGHLVQGKGTRDMLLFAFQLLRERGQTKVQLADESTIACTNGNIVKLGIYYFVKHGKTWYEHYFGFRPITHVDDYRRAKELRSSLDLDFLQSQPCEYFMKDVIDELIAKLKWSSFFKTTWEKKL